MATFGSGRIFGKTEQNCDIESFLLTGTDDCPLTAEILTYGATLRKLLVPKGNGILHDVVLGCDNISDYEQSSAYMGCVVGRVANRIKWVYGHIHEYKSCIRRRKLFNCMKIYCTTSYSALFLSQNMLHKVYHILFLISKPCLNTTAAAQFWPIFLVTVADGQ